MSSNAGCAGDWNESASAALDAHHVAVACDEGNCDVCGFATCGCEGHHTTWSTDEQVRAWTEAQP